MMNLTKHDAAQPNPTQFEPNSSSGVSLSIEQRGEENFLPKLPPVHSGLEYAPWAQLTLTQPFT